MKTGFILHFDSLNVLDELTDEQAGILFKAIRAYNLGEELNLDFAMKMAFLPFKNQFKRDCERYEERCKTNKGNGLKGGRPKKPIETEITESVFEEPKKADNKNDNKNKNENIEERKSKFYGSISLFIDKYPKKMLREFYDYWSEHGEKDKKMRFEKEKTFGIEQRLRTWYNRNPDQYSEKQIDPLVEYVKRQTGLS
jgi:hypothetical protein